MIKNREGGLDIAYKKYSEEQIISILREAEAEAKAQEICRKYSVSDATYYRWKTRYAGLTDNFAMRAFEELFLISPPV